MAPNPFEVLYVFAEIHVGFLGFSGLAGVMSKSSWQTKEVSLRFWVLLAFGLMGIMQSMLPVILAGFVPNMVHCFFISCIFGIICWTFQTILFSTRVTAAYKAGEWFRIPSSLNLLYQIPASLSIICYLAGLYLNEYETYIYLSGLLFFTAAATGNFICFLVANQRVEDDRDGTKNI